MRGRELPQAFAGGPLHGRGMREEFWRGVLSNSESGDDEKARARRILDLRYGEATAAPSCQSWGQDGPSQNTTSINCFVEPKPETNYG